MIYQRGSLFDSDAPAIAQGCNAQGVMGAGIAKEFKRRWPDMYENYRDLCREGILVGGNLHEWKTDEYRIFNLITQTLPGANADISFVRYSAYAAAAIAVHELAIDRIAIPRIGCGIGGLQWDEVEDNLLFIEAITEVQFEVWTPPAQAI